MKKLAIIGAGAWGSALAFVSLHTSLRSVIWSKNPAIVEEINQSGTNTKYTGQTPLSGLRATGEIQEALTDADVIINALPANAITEVFTSAKSFIKPGAIIINASKGLEIQTHRFPFEIFHDIFAGDICYFTVSGPSFADGLLRGDPTMVSLAGKDLQIGDIVREMIREKKIYLTVSQDIPGVEWGGIYKNVIAIAAGLSVGLGYGENTSALIFSAGIKEMLTAGVVMGASAETFTQPSGVGDLMLSTTSLKSRNFSFGYHVAQEKDIEGIFTKLSGIAEGYYTLQSVSYLEQKYNLVMPLATLLRRIIFHGMDAKSAFTNFLHDFY